MPSGIILSSGSQGATQEDIEKVFADHGLEVDKPETIEVELVEPKRDDFESDEAFEKAQEDFEAKQDEAEQQREEQEDEQAQKEEERQQRREQQQKKPTRRQRAIEKATKPLVEQLRKANERLAALEGKGATTAQPEIKAPEAPKRADFKTDQEFDDAMFDYRYALRRAKEDAQAAQKSLETRLQENFTDYKTAVAAFKDEHDDWDEVVTKSVPISQPVYYAIVDLGAEGPPVSYYLGQHPEEADRLAKLTPYRAAIEVGRLADKLKKGEKPAERSGAERPTRTRPRIPDPVRPVSTAATSSTLTSREAAQKGSYKDFKAAQRRGA